VKLTLKPVRRPTPPVLNTEDEESEEGEGDGEDTGSIGGAGTGTNGGEGGNGGRGGGEVRFKRIPISNVRILSIEGRDNCYRLSFRANGSGVVKLNFEEAGDSSAIRREDVRSLTDNVSLDHFAIVDGERTGLEITADSPIGGRAWRLSAVEAKGD
jgi:hypothetical protein